MRYMSMVFIAKIVWRLPLSQKKGVIFVKKLKRVVIKEELVELTGDFIKALILNQFIYWSERMADVDKYIDEEIQRIERGNQEVEIGISKSHGWIYKKMSELSDELMVGYSDQKMAKDVNALMEMGYIERRNNPRYAWDRTYQYRVNMLKIIDDLAKLGYALDGYKYLPSLSKTPAKDQSPKNELHVIKTEDATSKTENRKSETEEQYHRLLTDIKDQDLSTISVSEETEERKVNQSDDQRLIELPETKLNTTEMGNQSVDTPNDEQSTNPDLTTNSAANKTSDISIGGSRSCLSREVSDSIAYSQVAVTLEDEVDEAKTPSTNLPLDIDAVINFWNAQDVNPHTRLGDNTRKRIADAIAIALEDFTFAELCEAMTNYSEVYKDNSCYHKYRLVEFIERKGYEHFMEKANWTSRSKYKPYLDGDSEYTKRENPADGHFSFLD